jgi:hypothetical protein
MESGLSASGLHGRRMGSLALAGVVVFATTCTAAQFARSDLNWVRAPLSSYLRGDYGWGVKAAYFALSAALILLGIGYYRALATAARSGAPLLLFAAAAVALVVTALAESGSRSGSRGLEAFVHNLAAATAFLTVTTAMLLQSWRFRGDARWRHRFVVAFTLATVCFAAVWWHAYLVESSRGLTQKTVIALIVAWLALAAHWLRGHDATLVASSGSVGPST